MHLWSHFVIAVRRSRLAAIHTNEIVLTAGKKRKSRERKKERERERNDMVVAVSVSEESSVVPM